MGEKIRASLISDKSLVSKIFLKLLQVNSKKTQITQCKSWQRI